MLWILIYLYLQVIEVSDGFGVLLPHQLVATFIIGGGILIILGALP